MESLKEIKDLKHTIMNNTFTTYVRRLAVTLGVLSIAATGFSQTILVDGTSVLVSDQAKFPFWLAAGKSLAVQTNVVSISVIEYNVVASPAGGNILTLERVIHVTSSATVPANKAWKVEAVLLDPALAASSAAPWTDDGTVVRLTTNTDNVGVGNSTPTTKLDVTGSINTSAGFRVANTAVAGTYLRGDGTDFVASTIQASDIPVLNQNTTGNAATATVATTAANGVPPGAVFHFATSAPPSGYLECNGAAVSRSTYAELFAVIGVTYGVGNGVSTFNLPDLRGEFIRGWDHGRGVDGGRGFASFQNFDWKGFYMTNTGHNTHSYSHGPVYMGKSTSGYTGNLFTGYWSAGAATIGTRWDNSEIRPRNVAMLPCIKY